MRVSRSGVDGEPQSSFNDVKSAEYWVLSIGREMRVARALEFVMSLRLK